MEIKKLEDIITLADSWIEEMQSYLTDEEFENDTEVKEFEAVKKVVLESIERHKTYTSALNADIVAKDAKIDLLEKELEGRKAGYAALKAQLDTKYISIEEHNKICKNHEDTIEDYEEELKSLNDEVERRRNAYRKDSEFIVNIKKELEDWKERERTKSNMLRDAEAKIVELGNQNKYLKKELEETYRTKEADLKNHNKRDMTLVDELAGKNDKIKSLVEEIEYYKGQERIRTDQLRATESKVEELYKEIEQLKDENSCLKKECENKNDIIRKAYTRYMDEACKNREEIMNECYKKLTKDDTGYIGFKQYTLGALEAEKDEKEAKKFLSNAIYIIFYNKKAEEERKEEEAKKELNEAFGVPCGSDSIE